MKSKLPNIMDLDYPLFSIEEYKIYWNIWYQVWYSRFYNTPNIKYAPLYTWPIPEFYGNFSKTLMSVTFLPTPYIGNINKIDHLSKFEFVSLGIHPILKNQFINDIIFLNNNNFNDLELHYSVTNNIFHTHLIPWQSFNYHTDIASYLYEKEQLGNQQYVFENKTLIPSLIIASDYTIHKKIYTQSNFINTILLLNKFKFISCIEKYEKQIHDSNIYKVYELSYNEYYCEVWCKL